MNRYHKLQNWQSAICAQCSEEYDKGDIIDVSTERGQYHKCQVFNLVDIDYNKGLYYYSVVRLCGDYRVDNPADFSNPKSLQHYNDLLEKAQKRKEGIISGTIPKTKQRDLASISAIITGLHKKIKLAQKFWGDN